jgi:hypothetical protein
MRGRLPDIKINIDTDPQKFLEQMQQIALETRQFNVELHKDFSEQGLDILDISLQSSNLHVGLFGQFIAMSNKPTIIQVEIRAERWYPEPPTYKIYVESATEIIKPLLQLYNSSFGARHCLVIESAASLKPKLSPRANQRFKEFVTLANKQILHPLDWQRFYYFIHACSSRNIKTTQEDVKELLLLSNFQMKILKNLQMCFGMVYHY